MKRKIKKFLMSIIFVLSLFLGTTQLKAEEHIKYGKIELDSLDTERLEFYTHCDGIITIELRVVRKSSGGYFVDDQFDLTMKQLGEYDDEDLGKLEVSLPYGDTCCYWNGFYEFSLEHGKYEYEFESNARHDLLIYYTISVYPSVANSFSMVKETVNVTAGKDINLKISSVPAGSYLWLECASSNPNIAEVDLVDRELRIYGYRPGNCTVILKAANGYSRRVKVTVINPKKPILEYKSLTMYMGETEDNILHTTQKVKWSTSNKKVATVNSKGKITAKNVGKASITAKVGKKKYICKINVVRQKPEFYAQLYEYNTRNNYFSVVFYNNSNKSITIDSTGAKVMHVAYKAYDRNLKLKKKITIKPHKSISVRFYVKGRVTWYDYSRYTLQYKFKYDKKTYTGRVWDEESIYKNGKKWYHTYADTEDYEYWRYL